MSEPAPAVAVQAKTWPSVSVVMPVHNEAADLSRAIKAITDQHYPGELDIWLAIAPSSDGTAAVAAELAASDPRINVVANPVGSTPAGLNTAVRSSDGDVIVRVDGRAQLSAGYIRRAVDTLGRTGAVNVGGIQQAVGETTFERAVAIAITSMFGTGGSRFRVGGEEGPVDTVYLGVFRRDALEAVGAFDETLARNQDYELNIRLRHAGGVVWFDPTLAATYRPRGSLRALARQYFEYGEWKAEVLRRHPRSLRPRQALPPIATGLVLAGVVLAPRTRAAGLLPAGYALAVVAATVSEARGRVKLWPGVAASFITIHWSWSAGFVKRLVGIRVRQRGVR